MGNITYYPAQKLSVNGTEINFAQSASVDFNVNRQSIYEFGNLFPVDNIQVEPATAKLDFSYALGSSNNASALGLNNLTSLLSDVIGKTYTLLGAGTLTITNGVITSYQIQGSVGNIPIASVSVQGLNATYSAGNPTYPVVGTNSPVDMIRPDQIIVSLGGTYPCTSFSFGVEIPREYVNILGKLESIGIFVSGPPKAIAQADIILKDGVNPLFGTNDKKNITINCGGLSYTINNARITNFTSETKLDGVQSASVTLEAAITNTSAVLIGG